MRASRDIVDLDRRGNWRRPLSLVVIAILMSVVFVPLSRPLQASAAPGDPFDPNIPTVFVAQDVPTRLYAAQQTAGSVGFTPIGATAAIGYNAIGFNTTDNYLYGVQRDTANRTTLIRIGQGGVITSLGAISGLATPPAGQIYNEGTFGQGATAGVLYVRYTGGAGTYIGAINVATRTATGITLQTAVPNLSDIVWKDGFLWGVSQTDRIYRMNPATGQVSSWALGLGVNAAFGAQWVYGNGNIGLSDNTTGIIYQVAIANPTAATPTFTLVSTTTGPASGNNDGTAIPGLDVDLGIVKTGPAVYTAGAAITYTLTVTNNGPGASSGYQVTDTLPAGVTGGSSPTAGCTVAAGVLRCALAGLAVGATRTITVNGTVAAATTGLLTNSARVIGNELDPNPTNDQSTTTAAFSTGFRCTADVIYGLNTSGAVLAINRTTGASVQEGFFPAGGSALMNSLALTPDGRYAYTATQSGTKVVYRLDSTTGVASTLGTIPGVSANLFMGAINPTNGLFYVGGVTGTEYFFYAFDPVTNTSLGQQFRVTAPPGVASGANGDLAFDSVGRAFIVMSTGSGATGNQLVVVEAPPSDGSLVGARVLAYPAPASAQFQGIAFGSDGYLYTQHTSGANRVLSRVDPNSGAQSSSANILNPNGTANTLVSDLSSCTLNSTLTLRKNFDGRYAPGDQFTVTITGNGVTSGNTGTTTGSSTGLQTAPAASAGPIVGVPGRTYTITETPSGGAVLANYRSSWECRNPSNGNAVVASGTGASGTVTMPAATQAGSHIVCVFTNTPIPTWTLAKQALRGTDPLAAGARVQPGEVITYRVTATNTSAVAVSGTVLTDDLSDVLDDATFVAGSAQLVIAGGPPVVVSNPVGTQLTTASFTLPASSTAMLTYRVTISSDAWSSTLRNVVSGTAGAPGQPVPPQPCGSACTTSQVTPTPVQVQKVGEASTGAVVPMDGSSWAIFSAATGGTALVDPVPAAVSGGTPVTGLFRDVTLTAGTYWLEETRALDGFALLAGRVPFAVAADGTITLGAGVSSNVQLVDVDGIRTIRVEDVPALDLPDAGGPGDSWIYLIGLALLLAGTTAGTLNLARRRRALAVTSRGPRA
ncbi:DUF6923 family protein [Microbacterium sp. NPDC057944]|uniref:DUF6923 family protein n=1 Tax=Microbacterium sp. NPDC057944 TaxID=3346286 RepID=UPI0036DE0C6E